MTTQDQNSALAFGPFLLQPSRKRLQQDGRPVALGSRAFEMLVVLTERAGEVVGRDELIERVWPHSFVEEISLRVHISALRRALGDSPNDRYIINVPGQGYSFVANVRDVRSHPPPANWVGRSAGSGFPLRLPAAVGRELETIELALQLEQHRLVSVVGPGGQGKTIVALAVAGRVHECFSEGACFVDLGSLSDPALVPHAVAAALGLSLSTDEPLADLCRYIAEAHLLIVLDNCEHVVHAAAALVELSLARTRCVHVLVTSRERLYSDGEWVYRLPALASPPAALTTVGEALRFPALQLFVERAQAIASNFTLCASNVNTIAHLCRQLDGNPLAIELAAARVDSLGIDGLAARIDDVFSLLTRGRRTALARHGTLQALFDWSYELLSTEEKLVLSRLSVFRSRFSLEAAISVCAGDGLSPSEIGDAVLGLSAKSLIVLGASDSVNAFHLLNITRRYAASTLARSHDSVRVAARHARFLLSWLAKADANLQCMTPREWAAEYGSAPADLRAALDWCFSETGDRLLGLELTVVAWNPALELAMFSEYRVRVRFALLQLAELVGRSAHPAHHLDHIEIRLLSALALLAGLDSKCGDEYREVRDRMLPLLQRLGSDGNLDAIHSLCVGSFGQGDYFWVRMFAMRMSEVAKIENSDSQEIRRVYLSLSQRWTGLAAHYMGEHGRAREMAAHVLGFPLRHRYVSLLGQVPHSISMSILLARMDWIEGHADRALLVANEAAQRSADEHPIALCNALALAVVPIAVWRGDMVLAWAEAERLLEFSTRHALDYWTSWALAYQRAIALQAGPVQCVDEPPWHVSSNPIVLDMLATLNSAMVSPASLARVDQNAVAWNSPEVLRRQAVKLLAGEPSVGESMLQRALALARCQGALAWELRCAVSLGQHWHHNGRAPEGYRIVRDVYRKCVEGLETRDLRHARALLAQWREGACVPVETI